jgi:hypothetical protein
MMQFGGLIPEFCSYLYFISRVKEKTGVCWVGTEGSELRKCTFLVTAISHEL